MLILPIVAYSAFCKDFPDLNKWQCRFYYEEQCAGKWMWGINHTIKFIN